MQSFDSYLHDNVDVIGTWKFDQDATCRRRGSTRTQVFGNYGTMRAQGSLGNTKMGLRPISEMDSPSG